jgi:hypothetical protein
MSSGAVTTDGALTAAKAEAAVVEGLVHVVALAWER